MPEDKSEKLVSLMLSTSRLIREREKKEKKITPLSFLKMEALRYIEQDKNISMKELADFFCITPPSATSLVEGLVREGRLQRVADKNDRRLIRLTVTEKGRKDLNKGWRKIKKRISKIFANLNEKEKEELIKILKKLEKVYKK